MLTIIYFLLIFSTLLQANLIIENGVIWTVDKNNPSAQAVVLEKNKILYVGSNVGAKRFKKKTSKIIDLKGKLLLPGFIDSHVHFIDGGVNLTQIQLTNMQSIEDFIKTLKSYADKLIKADKTSDNKDISWIRGGRWDHERWKNPLLPHKNDIDSFTQNIPVLIHRYDGHMALANSFALKLAKIDKTTPNPPGSQIQKDSDGNLTGILTEEAINLVAKIATQNNLSQMRTALKKSMKYALENGVTSVHDMNTSQIALKTYQEFLLNNKLKVRIACYPSIEEWQSINKMKSRNLQFLKQIGVKGFADGSLGATTAWFFSPYSDAPHTNGLTILPSIEKLIHQSFDHKLQLAIHAIGDQANASVLALYKKLNHQNDPNLRLRIEHVQHLREQEISQFANQNVIASMQPWHLIDDANFGEKRLGIDRLKFTYAFRSLLDANVKLIFGSDWPVAPMKPLLGIWAATTQNWIPHQRISVQEAISAYTLSAAYASFDENIKGSIEVGKLADLVVLSDNILEMDSQKINEVKVQMTIVDGEIVY